jgi:hypothetical protein
MDKKSCQNCMVFPCTKYLKQGICTKWQRNPRGWLSILPTEPGWYWLKETGGKLQVVEIYRDIVYRSGTECFEDLKYIQGQWQGPITPEE